MTSFLGVLPQVGQPQRPGVGDERPEQAESLGQVTDLTLSAIVNAYRDELTQARAALVQDAECAVAGADQPHRRLGDPLEDRRQVKVRPDGQHGVEQLAKAPRASMLGRHAPQGTSTTAGTARLRGTEAASEGGGMTIVLDAEEATFGPSCGGPAG